MKPRKILVLTWLFTFAYSLLGLGIKPLSASSTPNAQSVGTIKKKVDLLIHLYADDRDDRDKLSFAVKFFENLDGVLPNDGRVVINLAWATGDKLSKNDNGIFSMIMGDVGSPKFKDAAKDLLFESLKTPKNTNAEKLDIYAPGKIANFIANGRQSYDAKVEFLFVWSHGREDGLGYTNDGKKTGLSFVNFSNEIKNSYKIPGSGSKPIDLTYYASCYTNSIDGVLCTSEACQLVGGYETADSTSLSLAKVVRHVYRVLNKPSSLTSPLPDLKNTLVQTILKNIESDYPRICTISSREYIEKVSSAIDDFANTAVKKVLGNENFAKAIVNAINASKKEMEPLKDDDVYADVKDALIVFQLIHKYLKDDKATSEDILAEKAENVIKTLIYTSTDKKSIREKISLNIKGGGRYCGYLIDAPDMFDLVSADAAVYRLSLIKDIHDKMKKWHELMVLMANYKLERFRYKSRVEQNMKVGMERKNQIMDTFSSEILRMVGDNKNGDEVITALMEALNNTSHDVYPNKGKYRRDFHNFFNSLEKELTTYKYPSELKGVVYNTINALRELDNDITEVSEDFYLITAPNLNVYSLEKLEEMSKYVDGRINKKLESENWLMLIQTLISEKKRKISINKPSGSDWETIDHTEKIIKEHTPSSQYYRLIKGGNEIKIEGTVETPDTKVPVTMLIRNAEGDGIQIILLANGEGGHKIDNSIPQFLSYNSGKETEENKGFFLLLNLTEEELKWMGNGLLKKGNNIILVERFLLSLHHENKDKKEKNI